ncbi:MAG: hypothetical protein KJ900_10675 [Proteobacteria bacterium]|jgi:hypothetical protein|nr:hypothetical protein [Desulfocapsa sp.]MBU3945042.1 hypothetical protein [Pseudomonadota bacterium]MCG2744458.1 hypothetical protein [Desulfobacteraceae bacterium]MBU4043342.1 hypothetical protein [Pseudomonadota bacterium]MBU4166469.1 hypothetical protein [Pseudomonadota bacterium]
MALHETKYALVGRERRAIYYDRLTALRDTNGLDYLNTLILRVISNRSFFHNLFIPTDIGKRLISMRSSVIDLLSLKATQETIIG